jgi:hypothetical protein
MRWCQPTTCRYDDAAKQRYGRKASTRRRVFSPTSDNLRTLALNSTIEEYEIIVVDLLFKPKIKTPWESSGSPEI